MQSVSENIGTKLAIRRQDAFEAYLDFHSTPPLLLRPPRDRKTGKRPSPREFALSIGLNDEDLLNLIDLQTQKNFGVKYGVAPQTLVRWNKLIKDSSSLDKVHLWNSALLDNVVMSLYLKIMQGKGQPTHYKLWFQIVAGWKEKQVAVPQRQIRKIEIEVVDTCPVATV